ncbi:hypothetical protein [Staphylococcus simiae]|uniref:SnoaL-like domain-containing protein n=1 Tax=Staphylococcus simiae CCM 7213 = CCUG 51256 TaxID=911238 RepID=G5JIA5_9STAP|nr:hypothetical protein [Staphylococcus simiae]EHJ08062.1 hypothetical protein SS7213T_05956 [Staphylococcus simiae CCM 7213 = CCUG 51256]PNZ11993.1 bile acid 7-alpha dehydratase [Staphylococcus simiae]SNV82858.1 Uncharacterised protein [Staphylococcus simiae]
MLFTRNQFHSTDDLMDKANIEEVIQFERFCRDHSLWDAMTTCFAKDSYINISWFKGNGEQFVQASKEMNRYAPHKIHSTHIWINGTKAVALMEASIQMRTTIKDTLMDLNSDAQLAYCLEKNSNDKWFITRLECIYEKDSLVPVTPSQIDIPDSEFQQYRSSYACLSYILNSIGYSVNHDLQGIDRPDEVNAYYNELNDWLTAQ